MHPDQKDIAWLLEEKYAGDKTSEYQADIDRLAKGEPVAYIIGYQPFLGLKIYLDSLPLIPRPETEWWTEQLLQKLGGAGGFERNESHSATAREEAIRQQANTPLVSSKSPAQPIMFLDLCAGSGAIGCAVLKYLPHAQVYFGEIDPAHTQTILKNIRANGLEESRAHIGIGDLFEPFSDTRFDIIACNPPYIPTERVLDLSVANYEPALALRSGVDGLDLIRRISAKLPQHLNPGGGTAWVECDRSRAETTGTIFEQAGFRTEIRSDQYNAPRFIVVSLR